LPLLISCPDCQTKYRVPETAEGKIVTCKSCGVKFKVEAGAKVAAEQPPVNKKPVDEAPPKAQPKSQRRDEDEDADQRTASRKSPVDNAGAKPQSKSRHRDDDDDGDKRRSRHDDDDDRPVLTEKKPSKGKIIGTRLGGRIAGGTGALLFALIIGLSVLDAHLEQSRIEADWDAKHVKEADEQRSKGMKGKMKVYEFGRWKEY
jgi:hypothetical protein